MPLERLLGVVDFEIPDRVREAAMELLVNPMIVVSLGIAASDRKQMTAVYFPDADFKVNRVSFPATFSPYNSPMNCHSIQAEITCRSSDPTWSWSDRQAVDRCRRPRRRRHRLGSGCDRLVARAARRPRIRRLSTGIRAARGGRTPVVSGARDRPMWPLQLFEYVNVDGAVARAADVAGGLNGSEVRLDAVPTRV